MPSNKYKVAVVVHLFYLDLLEEVIARLNNIEVPFDIYVTTTEENYASVMKAMDECFPNSLVNVSIVENRGRDIAPFLTKFTDSYKCYDLICKIHTKKSPHAGGINNWRGYLYDSLLDSPKRVASILDMFSSDPELGLVYPDYIDILLPFIEWGSNFKKTHKLLADMGITLPKGEIIDFAAGSMFWFRPKALERLFNLELQMSDFPKEGGQIDGTLAHAVERSFLYVVTATGYKYTKLNG